MCDGERYLWYAVLQKTPPASLPKLGKHPADALTAPGASLRTTYVHQRGELTKQHHSSTFRSAAATAEEDGTLLLFRLIIWLVDNIKQLSSGSVREFCNFLRKPKNRRRRSGKDVSELNVNSYF